MSILALLRKMLERYCQLNIWCYFRNFIQFFLFVDVFVTLDFTNVFFKLSCFHFQSFIRKIDKNKKLHDFLEMRLLIVFQNQRVSSRHYSCPLRTKPVHRLFSKTIESQCFTLHRFNRCLSGFYTKSVVRLTSNIKERVLLMALSKTLN